MNTRNTTIVEELTIALNTIAENACYGSYTTKMQAIDDAIELLEAHTTLEDHNDCAVYCEEFFESDKEETHDTSDVDDLFASFTNTLFEGLMTSGMWYYIYFRTELEDIQEQHDCFSMSKPVRVTIGDNTAYMYLAGDGDLFIYEDCDEMSPKEEEKARREFIDKLEDLAILCFTISCCDKN